MSLPPIPAEFVGVWERIELTVDGRTISDAGRSFWFQDRSRFLDVRAAGGGLPSEAFGGFTTWDAGTETLAWSHEIDMHPGPGQDSGRVEWNDGDLIEHGTAEQFDEVIGYTEVWRRRSAPEQRVSIADRAGGIGRLAWCGRLGAVTIDDRPSGPLKGGVFTYRGWGQAFDIVQGQLLGPERAPLQEFAGEDTFSYWGEQWRRVK